MGRNYVEHAKEMGFTGREPPFFFMKPADAVLPVVEGQVGRMHLYPSLTKDLHHEVELVVAIGAGGRNNIRRGRRDEACLGLRRRPGHDPPRPAERGDEEAGRPVVHRQGLRGIGADRARSARPRTGVVGPTPRSCSRVTAPRARRATCRS